MEKIRLIDETRKTASTVAVKPTASGMATPAYSRDELLYKRVCDGILSLRLVECAAEEGSCQYRLLVCSSSSEEAPLLVNIFSSLSVDTFNRPTNQDIGIISNQSISQSINP